ncbi:hypothetical protein M0L63_RS21930 [Providencia rettgeri]|uniref:hypothetical protein n=1 Tax=Providencia rettgeri TaxID=587 RepID=UPI001F04CBA2|nr:hypothetical protein [Providencia rettgeri]EJD6581124.1 hypothetical protein [Providencia rettgeri]EJD6585345.1 hypothetical protein [Providencia rettgeri]ELR5076739.1 hypothetical protein [Providencia rettgeri]ELR5080196.1 hypothetical protein [Providencia rettgeri]MCG9950223.1 hypothetical protein [Providencia rettgeri]
MSAHKGSLFNRNEPFFSNLSNLEHICVDCIRIENEKERQEKVEYIDNLFFIKKENALSINDLSFENSVFLLALIRCCADENLMYLDSLDNRRYEKLTPNYNFDLLIIEQLYTAGLVTHFPASGSLSL